MVKACWLISWLMMEADCSWLYPFCCMPLMMASNAGSPGRAASVNCAWCRPARFSHMVVVMDVPKAPNTSRTRSEEHTSELQSLMRISYAVFCLKKKKNEQYNEK